MAKSILSTFYWFPVADRVGQVTVCHVYVKIYLNSAPAYMSKSFTPVSDINNYPSTRFRVKLITNLDRSI